MQNLVGNFNILALSGTVGVNMVDEQTARYFDEIRDGNRGFIEYEICAARGDQLAKAIDGKGNTILLAAIDAGFDRMAVLFVNLLSDLAPGLLNTQNHEGWTAIHLAMVLGADQVFDALCETGKVDPNIKVHGMPLIVDALDTGNPEYYLEPLLEMPNIDITATGRDGKNVRDCARWMVEHCGTDKSGLLGLRVCAMLDEHAQKIRNNKTPLSDEIIEAPAFSKRPVIVSPGAGTIKPRTR